MTLEHLIESISREIKNFLDIQKTGMLNIEVHARDGGIGRVFFIPRKEIKHEVTKEQ